MATTTSKKRVKDIAALFGEQISVKKVKTGCKIRQRRNSATLRSHRRNLRNIKSPKFAQNDTNPFETATLRIMETPATPDTDRDSSYDLSSQTDEISIDIHPTSLYDDDTDTESDMDCMDETHIDIDEFINHTYGGWRQWSQSSYLSSMDISACEAGDARDSVCADTDSDDSDTDDTDTEEDERDDIDILESMQRNERLSQQIIMMSQDRDMLERLEHLEAIGATRTRDYLANQIISDSNATASNPTTPNLFGADDDYISSSDSGSGADVNDIIGTDEEREIIDTRCGVTVDDLLTRFGIYAFTNWSVYRYFHEVLGIRSAPQLIDVSPSTVRKPPMKLRISLVIKLHKMCKYIARRVTHGEWNGLRSKEWIELETNSLFHVFQHKSATMCDYNDCAARERDIESHCMRMRLSGFQKKYFGYLNANALADGDVIAFKVMIQQLPDSYRFEPGVCHIGVECNNESLYISDRCIIRANEAYVNCMFVGQFVESGSEILFKLSKDSTLSCDDSNNEEHLNINICHRPKGQRTTLDHDTFSKDYKMKIDVNWRTSIKLFVEQYRGDGVYSII